MSPEALQLRLAIVAMTSKYGTANRDYAFAIADGSPTLRAHRKTVRRYNALLRLVDALANVLAEPEPAAISAVRRLCESYATDPPPLFADPPTEHGKGYNAGTQTMAVAVLGAIDDAMGGQR